MSWSDDANKTLTVASAALHALEAIGPIAKGILGDKASVLSSNSMAQIAAITLAVDAIRKGLEGKISPADVEAEISKLHAGRQANADATKSEIDKKFPTRA